MRNKYEVEQELHYAKGMISKVGKDIAELQSDLERWSVKKKKLEKELKGFAPQEDNRIYPDWRE